MQKDGSGFGAEITQPSALSLQLSFPSAFIPQPSFDGKMKVGQ